MPTYTIPPWANDTAPAANATRLTDIGQGIVDAQTGVERLPTKAVRVATTANITLSGTQTIDGVAVIASDRVLVKNQTTGSQNGIYVVASGAWSRAIDADSNLELYGGSTVSVSEGTANGGKVFSLTTAGSITLGSTSLTFEEWQSKAQADLRYPKPFSPLQYTGTHTQMIQSALSAALAAGEAEVYIPARPDGQPWVIDRVAITGTGVERLYIRCSGQIRSSKANTDVDKNIFHIQNLERVVMEGLDIYYTGAVDTGSSYSGTQQLIYVQGCNSVKLVRCRGQYSNHSGIYLWQCNHVDVFACEGHYNRVAGVWIANCNYINVSGGEYSNSGLVSDFGTGYGVTCTVVGLTTAPKQVIFNGINVYDVYHDGLDCHCGEDVVITNCTVRHVRAFGIYVTGWGATYGWAKRVIVANNVVDDVYYRESTYSHPKYGIALGAFNTGKTDYVHVANNIVTNVPDYGISLFTEGAKVVKAVNNTVDLVHGSESNLGRGISVTADGMPENVTVSGNTVRRTREKAIYVAAGKHADVIGNSVSTTTATWTANASVILQQEVKPTVSNGKIYEATQAGTTHATTQPTWPTTIGGTVTDGTVIWQYVGDEPATGIELINTTAVPSAIVQGNSVGAGYATPYTIQQGSLGRTGTNNLVAGVNQQAAGLYSSDTLLLPTGVIAETMSRNAPSAANLPITSGRIQCYAIGLRAGSVISSITFCSGTTALATPTNQWFALYSSSLAKLGVTSDDTTSAWPASTRKTLTLSSPYTVPSDGLYYVGVVVVATTPPTLAGVIGLTAPMAVSPTIAFLADSGLTTPATAPATLTAPANTGLRVWAYVS